MRRTLLVMLLAACDSGGISPGPSFDMSAPTRSSQLLAGDYGLWGETSDNYLLLYQRQGDSYAVAPGSSTPMMIGSADALSIAGQHAFLFTDVDASVSREALAIWSAADGLHMLATSSSLWSSPSLAGDYLIFSDNVTSDGNYGDFFVSRIDGSDRKMVVAHVPTGNDTSTSGCGAYADTLGSAFLVAYCKSVDADAGTQIAELIRFDPASGTTTSLVTDASYLPSFFVDSAHTQAVAIDDMGQGLWLDSAGNPTVFDQGVYGGRFAPDGTILYNTAQGLSRWDSKSRVVTQLQTFGNANFPMIHELSPDSATALFSLNFSSTDAYGVDLYTASTKTPGAPLGTLLTTTTGESVTFGLSSFTSDSSYVLYINPIDTSFTGPLRVSPVSGGTGTLISDSPSWMTAMGGSKLAFCENLDKTDNTCDLRMVDAAKPAEVTLLDTKVITYNFFMSNDGAKLYYAVRDGTRSGIYTR